MKFDNFPNQKNLAKKIKNHNLTLSFFTCFLTNIVKKLSKILIFLIHLLNFYFVFFISPNALLWISL